MAFQIKSESKNQNVLEEKGAFKVIEFTKDPSVNPINAEQEYFMGLMNVRKRQVQCVLSGDNKIITQSGAMQWTAGNVQSQTDLKGVGDFIKKNIRGSVTKESAVKPLYSGTGIVTLEPTYKHILLVDLADWHGGIVMEDGMFLACDAHLKQKAVARSNVSSAVFGKEGLFNLSITGDGVVVLESNVPRNELIEVELKNDVLKIDGSNAMCWSPTLEFTVERSSRSLVGSAMNGEGFVNVFRGTGKVWLCPTSHTNIMSVQG